MNPIVHITTRADWQTAQQEGEYRHPSLITDGYIHCSLPTREQLLAVANAYFIGQPDLVLLVMDRQRLSAPVQDEKFEDSGLFFPHVYGSINAAAVLQVLDFLPQADGSFSLPTAFSGTHNTAEQENLSLPRTLSS
ncbi:DUF952 domain-containing protein [Deinococcus sp. SM5_A1]|uniref:DUF952 domain-containing protein n=1 Tax=Deinococcus sp. SM5_A1 TaxID=3379094 RepID=UPI00385B412C